MPNVRLLPAILLLAATASVAHAYGPVPEGFVSVYFSGPAPLPNGQAIVLVASCVSNEVKAAAYPGTVRFEAYRSDLTVPDPNLVLIFQNRALDGPGFAPEAAFTITNAAGVTATFHVRILAEKRLARGLLCHASYTNSLTAPTYRTSLPLERRGKTVLPKDTAP